MRPTANACLDLSLPCAGFCICGVKQKMANGVNEDEVIEQTEAQALGDFNAGFDGGDADQVASPEPEAAEAAEEAPKTASITEQDWNELRSKATAIDEIKADSQRKFDNLAGNIGGLKQVIERLQTRSGMKLSPGQLKRTAAEFPELEAMLTEDLNEILSAPQQGSYSPEEIDQRAKALMDVELPKMAVALEKKLLRSYHRDWVDVLRSDDFKAWQLTIPPDENAKLMSSVDGEFIADKITEFKDAVKAKAAVKPSPARSARQTRIEAAIPAKGSGGHAPAPSDEDEFNAGFNRSR